MSKSYYAAANTAGGFRSLFSELFPPQELSRLYIVKGGPGTGKSTFMRAVGKEAEARGLEVEYYYCSADTSSLDGVKIPALGVAMLDGTAPHVRDPRYPGACETVLNLGEFFDADALRRERASITALADACTEHYKTASRLLCAAGETERALLGMAEAAFDGKKAKAAAVRMLGKAKPKGGACTERYISALGVHGMARIANEPAEGKHTVGVSGRYGFPKLFMQVLTREAQARGYTLCRFTDVLLPEHTEALFIEELDTLFFTGGEGVNTGRFVEKEALAGVRMRLRFAEKCRESLVDGALAELGLMGARHTELERYYVRAMDFEKSRALLERVKAEIFG